MRGVIVVTTSDRFFRTVRTTLVPKNSSCATSLEGIHFLLLQDHVVACSERLVLLLFITKYVGSCLVYSIESTNQCILDIDAALCAADFQHLTLAAAVSDLSALDLSGW